MDKVLEALKGIMLIAGAFALISIIIGIGWYYALGKKYEDWAVPHFRFLWGKTGKIPFDKKEKGKNK